MSSFYVAGARFHASRAPLAPGDPVEIRRESWRGQPCYAVYTGGGKRLGYIPRRLAPRFDDLAGERWHLAAVDRTTVPWKWYLVGASALAAPSRPRSPAPPRSRL